MNWKLIGKHLFLSPLYALLLFFLGFGLFIIFGSIGFVVYWLFSDWMNFVWIIGTCWACAIVGYLLVEADADGLL